MIAIFFHHFIFFGLKGAGKSHVMELLGERGIFPLDSFVRVDPDRLRRELPEMQGYVQRDPATAGLLTHKEVRGRVLIRSLGIRIRCDVWSLRYGVSLSVWHSVVRFDIIVQSVWGHPKSNTKLQKSIHRKISQIHARRSLPPPSTEKSACILKNENSYRLKGEDQYLVEKWRIDCSKD